MRTYWCCSMDWVSRTKADLGDVQTLIFWFVLTDATVSIDLSAGHPGDTHQPFAQLGKSLKLPQTATLALRAPLQ